MAKSQEYAQSQPLHWFVREHVSDGIWHVYEPAVHHFARCNIWVVRGRARTAVIDTGLGVMPLAHFVSEFVTEPTTAIATHYHFDHVGSLYEFDDRAAHAIAAPIIGTAGAVGGALRRSGYAAEVWQSFLDAGYELPDDLLTALPYAEFDANGYAVAPCSLTRTLVEGDVVDLGGVAYEVQHLPGHSPDSIGLYDARNGVLFSGDAVYDGPLLDEAADSSVDAYIATMERLRTLPITVVHGGHERSFGRDRLVELCDAYLARRRSR